MIALGCDHGGYGLMQEIKAHLEKRGLKYRDFGTYSDASCDYPEYARAAAKAVASGECERGIVICGTGIGMSIAANKIKGIRAALCADSFSTRFTRMHNNSNVMCMGARTLGCGLACELAEIFLTTEFEGGRHQRRIDLITAIENNQ